MPAPPRPWPLTVPLFIGFVLLVSMNILAVTGKSTVIWHTAIELFGLVIGFCAFVIGWKARVFLSDNYLILIGVSYFFVGLTESFHLLVDLGAGFFPGDAFNLSSQLRVSASLMESVVFLVAVSCPHQRFPVGWGLTLLTFVTIILLWSILGGHVFPDCFDPAFGATFFRLDCGFVIIALSLAALTILAHQRLQFHPRVQQYLAWACLFRAAAEFFAIVHGDISTLSNPGLSDVLSHLLKVASYVCVLKGIVETALVQPLALISTSLERERRLSAELEHQAHMLRTVLAVAPDPHFLFDRDLRFSYANPAVLSFSPVPPEAWVGRNWQDLGLGSGGFSPLERQLAGVFASGQPAASELGLLGRHFEVRLMPLSEADGVVVGVLAVLRDATERTAVEQRLRLALKETEKARAIAEQANEAKSRFLSAASHDLRQPLQATRLFLEVLSHRLGQGDNRELLERAKEALSGGDDLLRSLLDLGKLHAEAMTITLQDVPLEVLFSRLLDECQPMATAKRLDLRVVPCGATVRSDPVMLQRLLRNLLNNAIRYTTQGKVLLGCRRRGATLDICVVDTGCGIPAGQEELIFEEFYQVGNPSRTRSEGLGLGLSIVRHLARLLGHGLLVRSREGVGSLFAVSVPLEKHESPILTNESPPTVGPLPIGCTVLVVEDDPQQRVALGMLLESWGFDVHLAPNADAALAQITDSLRPALILSDLRLPGIRSGIDLVREVRTHCAQAIPALLLTGDTDPRRLAEARGSGLALLHKPFTVDALRLAVYHQLE